MDRHIINQDSTILQAFESLNKLSGEVMTLFVVDDNNVMSGTLTDGDIRRAILSGAQLSDKVTRVQRRDFSSLKHDDIDVGSLRHARQRGIRLLPVLDSNGQIKRIVDLSVTKSLLPLSAILMAGGKGERLRPMTLTTPKPLLKIDGKAIIDYNIEALAAVGIDDITVTTRYLADQIADHFSKPVAGVNVKTVEESKPLGTIGAASLIERRNSDGATLVMNSDLLTNVSFEDMFLRHSEECADITVAAIPYQVSVPYAILTTDGPRITGLEEKPSYSYYANAGIYIISNRLLDSLPTNAPTDATDLVEQAIAQGLKVVYFPINGTWIDVGSPVDFKHAEDLMREARSLNLGGK